MIPEWRNEVRTPTIFVLSTITLLMGSACGVPQPKEGLVEDLAEIMPSAPDTPGLDGVSPDSATTVFENGHVLAVRVRLEPGERIPGHLADFRVVYAMSDFSLEVSTTEETIQRRFSPGEVSAWEPGRYSFENVDDAVADYFVVSRKGSAASKDHSNLQAHAEAPTPPESAGALLFSNNELDVLKVDLEPGEEHQLSLGYPSLVYGATPAAVDFRSVTGAESRVGLNKGRVVWLDPEVVIAENSGNRTARLVVFSLKWIGDLPQPSAIRGGG
jgi:hypothetical protein